MLRNAQRLIHKPLAVSKAENKDDILKFEARKESTGKESSYNPEEYRRKSLNMSIETEELKKTETVKK